MEMRSLSRCLRSRPTTSLLYTQPSIRSLNGLQFLRYSSTDGSKSSSPPPPPSNSKNPFRTSQSKRRPTKPSVGIDQILQELNLNSRDSTAASSRAEPGETAEPSTGPPTTRGSSFTDALSLTRAVSISAETEHIRQAIRKVELKLGPTLGRQVHVEPEKGVDLAAALRMLQVACGQNRVRQQSNQQKFHIRRGQMKKNLRMERWRKLFKVSFTHTVSKIQRMRAQGW